MFLKLVKLFKLPIIFLIRCQLGEVIFCCFTFLAETNERQDAYPLFGKRGQIFDIPE